MRDHVFVVGKLARIAVPGCEAIAGGCIASYPQLVALATVGTAGDLRTTQLPVSPVFVVHPRGFRSVH